MINETKVIEVVKELIRFFNKINVAVDQKTESPKWIEKSPQKKDIISAKMAIVEMINTIIYLQGFNISGIKIFGKDDLRMVRNEVEDLIEYLKLDDEERKYQRHSFLVRYRANMESNHVVIRSFQYLIAELKNPQHKANEIHVFRDDDGMVFSSTKAFGWIPKNMYLLEIRYANASGHSISEEKYFLKENRIGSRRIP